MSPRIVVVGVDPGTALTGYGVVAGGDGALRLVSCGLITTQAGDSMEKRLLEIHDQISWVIGSHRPDAVAVEQLFFGRNVRSASSVGQARGAVLVAAARHLVKVEEFAPLQVKMALVGYGRASKEQVQSMVKALLGLEEAPSPDDVADAVAVAICCINRLCSAGGRLGGFRE